MSVRFIPIPSEDVIGWQAGGVDSYGLPAKQKISDGDGVPCRHCLENIGRGDPYLVLAHRPFSGRHAYTETGPIFVHAAACRRADSGDTLPSIFNSASYILRGYDDDETIVYGTGGVVDRARIIDRAETILENPAVAFIHARSAQNNCFHCRIERAGT